MSKLICHEALTKEDTELVGNFIKDELTTLGYDTLVSPTWVEEQVQKSSFRFQMVLEGKGAIIAALVGHTGYTGPLPLGFDTSDGDSLWTTDEFVVKAGYPDLLLAVDTLTLYALNALGTDIETARIRHCLWDRISALSDRCSCRILTENGKDIIAAILKRRPEWHL